MPFAPARSGPPAPAAPQLPASRRQAVVVWCVQASLAVLALAGALVAGSIFPAGRGTETLRLVFLAVGAPMVLADLSLAYVVTGRMRRSPPAGATADQSALTQTVVGAALAVASVLMCAVFYFVSREPILIALAVPALAVLVHWFPSATRWTGLAPAHSPSPDGPAPRRPMVRE